MCRTVEVTTPTYQSKGTVASGDLVVASCQLADRRAGKLRSSPRPECAWPPPHHSGSCEFVDRPGIVVESASAEGNRPAPKRSIRQPRGIRGQATPRHASYPNHRTAWVRGAQHPIYDAQRARKKSRSGPEF